MTRIVVVDNHGQFTHLEHRALRDLDGVSTDLIDNTTPPEEIDADGLVLSGGPDMDDIGNCPEYLDLGVPVLGICLGMQLIATEVGGEVTSGEYGGYADEVTALPEGFERTAQSDVCDFEAMGNQERDLYGVQWHPEVAHTAEGEEVFENFKQICESA